ncbi:Eco57I restriction-modification methylase domain-containing protein [Roseimaritima multifibrata]|nr:type IIL restriction-modification enzyme MmeI [Roseimaritima multifibrata]
MGFNLQVATGKSIAIKPVKSHGAPATIDLDELLETAGKDRGKWLKENADQKVGTADAKLLKAATNIEELLTALDKKIAKKVTPRVVPAGAIVLQPSDERRRSGSHYTPRSLTEPIVRTTLEPILKQLCDPTADLPTVWEPTKEDRKKKFTQGEIDIRIRASKRKIKHAQAAREIGTPHPSQILDLKICDPAMGSGAFLVEACRQLGDHLIKAWYAHSSGEGSVESGEEKNSPTHSPPTTRYPPLIPPDEDEVLYARRLIAQRCLYGVDKNVMAVDLAKLSLWLVTLAKDHAFTFLDHALRHGDSLVGLTREQIIGFHWEVKKQKKFGEDLIQRRLDRATEARAKILNAREDVPYRDQAARMASSDEALDLIRLVGDACVSGFFASQKKKEREEEVERLFGLASSYLSSISNKSSNQTLTTHHQSLTTPVDFESRRVLGQAAARLRAGSHPIPAFHWEIEFPEVFARENGGFDAFVGNPPFLGGSKISGAVGKPFLDWIMAMTPESHGNGDLVAYFFRQCFSKIRSAGTSGLIASNTIAQGDTRQTGLAYICEHGGTIYNAIRRMRWPGEAAVVVSQVFFAKHLPTSDPVLDGKPVEKITAFLFTSGGNKNPHTLNTSCGLCFKGVDINGMGFTFDDDDSKGVATPIAVLEQLRSESQSKVSIVSPFIGGQELNNDPRHRPSRYVINFGNRPLEECFSKWPELVEIATEKVKPERMKKSEKKLRAFWWKFGRRRDEMFESISGLERLIVTAETSPHHSFAFLPGNYVYAQSLRVFAFDTLGLFAVLQSRCHEMWARCFGSSMKDDLRYTPTDCFETYPLPSTDSIQGVERIGNDYCEFRSTLMLDQKEGLTSIYNRFHDPHEQSEGILELRRLHGLMDGAVLRAYGWDDLAESARCEFLLDYEEEEDDADAGPPAAKKKSKKKKPWRFRWPDEFRDEVLARLLELNEQRHKEEQLLGKQKEEEKKESKEDKKKSKKPQRTEATPLFDELDRDEAVVLMIVRYFGLITRRAVDEAFIAMRSPKLRKSRLGVDDPPKTIPRTDAGRDALIGGLIDKKYLEKHPSTAQQVLKIGSVQPPLGDLSAADQTALEETKAIFERAIEDGNDLATVNEGVTDARPGLVSSA